MIDAFKFQHSLTGSEVLMPCKCEHYELWDHFQCQKRLEAEVVWHRNLWDRTRYAPFTKHHKGCEWCF